jgi:hypothetical protein
MLLTEQDESNQRVAMQTTVTSENMEFLTKDWFGNIKYVDNPIDVQNH